MKFRVPGSGFRVVSKLISFAAGNPKPGTRNPEPRASRAGFTLMELLIAIFVLTIAVAGAIGVIYVAGRSSGFTRQRAVASGLADVAVADALYAAEEYRDAHVGSLDFTAAPFDAAPYSQKPADVLGPAGCQKTGYRKRGSVTDYNYGWLWRAHSFEAATGLYSLDVWVFHYPDELSVSWGYAGSKYESQLRRNTLLYLRTKVGKR